MTQRIVIEPVTRIEGHGKITVQLDENGEVNDARFHVTQFRGFEKLCVGRPFYEMPSLTERICGICPISHSLASAKACDQILGVKVPETASLLRKLLHCGQLIQSHALSFFHLSGPDLVMGFSCDPEQRNLVGMMKTHEAAVRDGIRLRAIGQTVIETFAKKRIHPSWVVPGGVNEPLTVENRDAILSMLPEAKEIARRTLLWFKPLLENHMEEMRTFANFPSIFLGIVDADQKLEFLEGDLCFVDHRGRQLGENVSPANYKDFIEERVEPWSYLKSPYYKPLGYEEGLYRVGPAARLNVCQGCGTPLADQEWAEFRSLERGAVLSSFHNHYARLVEILYAIETIEELLNRREALDSHVRSWAAPNFHEGIGVIEAPRGTLIHHYQVDDDGLITGVNLIVATGNNNLAMNRGVLQVARRFVNGDAFDQGAINRIEGVIRAFDPCLSCSTHHVGGAGMRIELLSHDGKPLDVYP